MTTRWLAHAGERRIRKDAFHLSKGKLILIKSFLVGGSSFVIFGWYKNDAHKYCTLPCLMDRKQLLPNINGKIVSYNLKTMRTDKARPVFASCIENDVH